MNIREPPPRLEEDLEEALPDEDDEGDDYDRDEELVNLSMAISGNANVEGTTN